MFSALYIELKRNNTNEEHNRDITEIANKNTMPKELRNLIFNTKLKGGELRIRGRSLSIVEQ